MRTTWQETGGEQRQVVAPLSLIVSAFAPCDDVRPTWTPQLRPDRGRPTSSSSTSRAAGGASAARSWPRSSGRRGTRRPTSTSPRGSRASTRPSPSCARPGSSSPITTVRTAACFVDPGRDGLRRATPASTSTSAARRRPRREPAVLAALFTEELGVVLQVRRRRPRARPATSSRATASRPSSSARRARRTSSDHAAAAACSSTSRAPTCSGSGPRRPGACRRCATTPSLRRRGVRPHPRRGRPRPLARPHLRPRGGRRRALRRARRPARAIAILREQGVNGQVEMAAAFDRAGFEAVDVHMSDVIAGRVSLADFNGFAACGGFSYGDVLGAGEGWAKSILFNARARDEFAAFFAPRRHLRARRLQRLPDDEQPARAHPRRRALAALRARTARSSSRRGSSSSRSRRARRCFFAGMAGSRIPVATAHGEGRALFTREAGARGEAWSRCASSTTTARRPRATRQPQRLAARASPASRRPTAASRS